MDRYDQKANKLSEDISSASDCDLEQITCPSQTLLYSVVKVAELWAMFWKFQHCSGESFEALFPSTPPLTMAGGWLGGEVVNSVVSVWFMK